MRFSVLLPTKNGARFLRGAIESVLAQPLGPDTMELVISDNASTDETPAIIEQYRRDPRTRAVRLPEPLPVTDNWNNALRACEGEYVLVIGDDDALLPGCLPRLDELLRRHGAPECLGFNGFLYVAPGSIFENAASYFKQPYHPYFDPEPVELSRERRMGIVERMFRFEQIYPLNMQLTVFSRRIGFGVRGGVFQPPFPDHYGLNALLIESPSFVTVPDELVVVGVSPKSFGHYYFGDDQAAGLRFLETGSSFPGRLPGNEIVNCMYEWLLLLKRNYPDLLSGFEVDHAAYVRHQAEHWKKLYWMGRIDISRAALLTPRLGAHEALRYLRDLGRLATQRIRRRLRGELREPRIEDVLPIARLESVASITDFIAYLRSRSPAGAGGGESSLRNTQV